MNFEDLGEKAVKNIDRPLHVYRIVLDEKAEALLTVAPGVARAGKLRGWHVAAGAGAICLLLGTATWLQGGYHIPFWPDTATAARPALPDKPSLVVLPFDNLSGDPGQAYFADGISEDLTTDLSKLTGLFVIARHSAFQ